MKVEPLSACLDAPQYFALSDDMPKLLRGAVRRKYVQRDHARCNVESCALTRTLIRRR